MAANIRSRVKNLLLLKKALERILNAHPRDVASIVKVRTRAAQRGSDSRAGGGHKWRLLCNCHLSRQEFDPEDVPALSSVCGKGPRSSRELNNNRGKTEFFGCLRVGCSGFYSVLAHFPIKKIESTFEFWLSTCEADTEFNHNTTLKCTPSFDSCKLVAFLIFISSITSW